MELLQDLGMQKPTTKSKYLARFGIYKCICGNEFKTKIANANDGHTKSCGCLKKKHNLCGQSIYNVYMTMKARCYNKKSPKYKGWGARGITICSQWLIDFTSFYNWALNNGYKQGLSIDRINNDGNYEPSNCRWTTQTIQSRNTRKIISTNTSGYRGVSWHKQKKKFQASICVNSKSIYLGRYKCRMAASYAYDNYVIENNLEHTRNFS